MSFKSRHSDRITERVAQNVLCAKAEISIEKIESYFNELEKLRITLTNLSLTDYAFIHNDSTTNAGSVAIYIKKQISVSVRNDLNFNINGCEDLWIEIEQKSAKTKKLLLG